MFREFLSRRGKEMAAGLTALKIMSGGAEASGQSIGEEADQAFHELDKDVARESRFKHEYELFKNRLIIEIGVDRAEKVMKALDEQLATASTEEQKQEILQVFIDQLAKRKTVEQNRPTPKENILARASDSFVELDSDTQAFKGFFDKRVPFEKAVERINARLKPGSSVEYNGFRFSRNKESQLFCEGRLLTSDSREELIRIFSDINSRLKGKTGAELK